MRALSLLLAIVVISLFCVADEKKDRGVANRIEMSPAEKARTAFIRKARNGQYQMWVRLVPTQYRAAKVRAKIRRGGKSYIRVLLRPRQIIAINSAFKKHNQKHKLKTGKRLTKIILRVRSKRLRQAKGLKGHFVIRPIDVFTKKGFRRSEDGEGILYDEDKEEQTDPKEKDSEKRFGKRFRK